MSGPNPPEPGAGAEDPGSGQPVPDGLRDDTGDAVLAGGGTEAYSQAYSAPESEHFTGGAFVPIDPRLYDYDSEILDEPDAAGGPPRWPWVVGVAVIIAAIALVVSVALLFVRTETDNLATPETTTSATPSLPPVQDEITTPTTPPPPPPPPPPSSEPPPPPPPPTTETSEAPVPAEPPSPESSTPTTTAPARPRQITYTVTGTKAPFDQITITYIDNSGQRRTQRNAYIPWSLTLTPISQSEVGSVEASSLLRLSKLNCSITSSDGTVLSANNNDAPQTSCDGR